MATTEQRIRNWANKNRCRVLGPKGGPYTLIERFGTQILGNFIHIEDMAKRIGEYAEETKRKTNNELKQKMTDDELIEAWGGEMTIPQIATTFGMTENFINHNWKKLRLLGKIPTGSRPRNRAKSAGRPLPIREDLDQNGMPQRPLELEDPLLKKLKQVHPEKMERKND